MPVVQFSRHVSMLSAPLNGSCLAACRKVNGLIAAEYGADPSESGPDMSPQLSITPAVERLLQVQHRFAALFSSSRSLHVSPCIVRALQHLVIGEAVVPMHVCSQPTISKPCHMPKAYQAYGMQ